MKIKSLFFFVFFFVSISAFGQMQDLRKLAEGKLVYGSILYDSNDDLYGYFYLFERDKDKVYKTMEYVFLDKNLNKTSNNTFKCYSYNNYFNEKYLNCTMIGDNVILSKYLYYFTPLGAIYTPVVNSFQIISLKDKTVSPEYQFDNDSVVKLSENSKELKTINKGSRIKDFIYSFNEGETKGFVITQQYIPLDVENKEYEENEFKFFDENKTLKWTYEYNPNGLAKKYTSCSILYSKNKNLYLLERKYVGKKPSEFHIVCIDIETGKPKYDYMLENDESRYSHTISCKEINGELEIAGNISEANQDKSFSVDQSLGFYKIVLDSAGNEIMRKYDRWSSFSEKMDIDEKGKIDKDFRLRPTKFFFFNDGSISILTEKYKQGKDGVFLPIPIVGLFVYAATAHDEKSTDFVLFNMDENFDLKSVKTIKKELSASSDEGGTYDYLFSQYINQGNDAVFFYQDFVKKDTNTEQKEDQWMLGICSIINGELSEEKIPITSEKKYVIEPLPAKEGYILLREYNSNDKYDQIRLEKLNY